MSKIFALIVILFLSCLPVNAQQITTPAGFTNTTAPILASSQTVTLVQPANNVSITTSPASSSIYVNFSGGPATTSHFLIPPGTNWNIYTCIPISSFTYIGSGTTGTYSVFAH